MTIPLKDIRPQVISEELAAELDEYLAFRHLFRSIYGFELKGDRIDHLAEKFGGVSRRFAEEMGAFLEHLRKELEERCIEVSSMLSRLISARSKTFSH
jgi:hypothetical protein